MYSPGDVVVISGNSFVAMKMVKGESPSISSPNWGLIASSGADGKPGDPGSRGSDGANGAGVPVGGSSGQFLRKITDADYDCIWETVSAQNIGASALGHKHDISDVIGLADHFSGFAHASHQHDMASINGLDASLTAKANTVHQHSGSDISGGTISADHVDVESVISGQTIYADGRISADSVMSIAIGGIDKVSISSDVLSTGLTIRCGAISVAKLPCPQESSSPGTPGDIRWDSMHLYLCVSNNTWKRFALSEW